MSQEKREERVSEDLRNFTQVLVLWQERKISTSQFQTDVVRILAGMKAAGNLDDAFKLLMNVVKAASKAIAKLGAETRDLLEIERAHESYEEVKDIRRANWEENNVTEFRNQIFGEIKRVFLLLMIRQHQVESDKDDQIDNSSTKIASPILGAFQKTTQNEDVRKKAQKMEKKGTMNVDNTEIDEDPDTEPEEDEDA